MLALLKSIYRKALFDSSILGFFLNPSFLARASLYQSIRKESVRFKGAEVLDVGCGAKPYRHLFKSAKNYVGVDTNNSGHSHAGEQIDLFYDGKNLPFKVAEFDGVVSFQVLEHVEDEDKFFAEINRVLKQDGFLLLSVPFCWCEHEKPYDFRRFTSFGLLKVCKEYGFEVLEIRKTTNYIQTLAQLFNTYLATRLKTPWSIVNIGMNLLFVAPINFLGIVGGWVAANDDLFCDLVVLARKK
jgi:ubiquinone/menaquinone biosynthesis C-methylase UbiE